MLYLAMLLAKLVNVIIYRNMFTAIVILWLVVAIFKQLAGGKDLDL